MMSSCNHAIGDLQGTNELTSQGADFMAAACRTLLGSSRDATRYSIQRYLQQWRLADTDTSLVSVKLAQPLKM